MKKIYLSIAALALCVGATAQNAAKAPKQYTHKGVMAPESRVISTKANTTFKTQNGPFAIQIDPIEQIMTQKAVDLTSANPQEDIFLGSVFQDSTVSIASGGDLVPNDDIFLGSVFDPKSIFLQSSFEPICSKLDSYSVDSVFLAGSYIKKTADTDTLYAWLVWGDSTNTSVFTKMNASNAWISPISTWRKSIIGPKVSGAVAAHGNKVKSAAPAGNQMLVKYVLQPQDSTARGYGYSKIISIPFTTLASPAGVTIPAGSIVSFFYTFVAGGTHTSNQAMYSFTTGVVPTINGFCGQIWNQNNPTITQASDFQSYQVDKDSWNMGLSYDKGARYAQYSATYNNAILGRLTSAPRVYYSLTGNSTVSVNELDKKGFVLGQNTPNPYKGESKVSYMLAKDAKSAVFTVTDIMGRVVYSENVNTTTGTHSVKLGSYTPGVYYYSLNVDGNISTNKMIAE